MRKMKKIDLKDTNLITLLGSMAFKEQGLKRMFNSDVKKIEKVNDTASRLALNTAGLQLRFTTNSKIISVKVKLAAKSFMNNMSAVGQSGLDIYVFDKKIQKYIFQKATVFDKELTEYEYELINYPTSIKRDYIINLPLYNSVNDIELFIEDDASIKPYIKKSNKNILFYGTSIVQGGCVSRPGLLYSNMISRNIDNEIYNFGFSGQAFLEKEMAEVIANVKNAKLLIIDAQPNAGVDDRLINNLPLFIETYRKVNPETIILVASRISYSLDYLDERILNQNKKNRNFLVQYIEEQQKQDKNIHYVDGYDVFGDDYFEYTVDGIHPNDIGSMKLAEFYLKKIKEFL